MPFSRMTLNISGQKFTIMTKLLEGKDESRIFKLFSKYKEKQQGRLEPPDVEEIIQLCDDYSLDDEGCIAEFFFSRNPQLFPLILEYLYSGVFHLNKNFCVNQISNELQYWGIRSANMAPCCLHQYTKEVSQREMDVYGSKSVVHDAILKTQLYLKSMETTSEQMPQAAHQRIYGTNNLKSIYNVNNNISINNNNGNNDADQNHTLNVGKSDSAEKSNKSGSPSQFENDYQSITEWNQRAMAAKTEDQSEERKTMLGQGIKVSESIQDHKTHRDGDCIKIRAKVWKWLKESETSSLKIPDSNEQECAEDCIHALIKGFLITLTLLSIIIACVDAAREKVSFASNGWNSSLTGSAVIVREVTYLRLTSPPPILAGLEMFCVIGFLLQYCLSYWASPRRLIFFFDVLNMIDLLSLAPWVGVWCFNLIPGELNFAAASVYFAFLWLRFFVVLRLLRFLPPTFRPLLRHSLSLLCHLAFPAFFLFSCWLLSSLVFAAAKNNYHQFLKIARSMNQTDDSLVPIDVSYHTDILVELMNIMVIMTSDSCANPIPRASQTEFDRLVFRGVDFLAIFSNILMIIVALAIIFALNQVVITTTNNRDSISSVSNNKKQSAPTPETSCPGVKGSSNGGLPIPHKYSLTLADGERYEGGRAKGETGSRGKIAVDREGEVGGRVAEGESRPTTRPQRGIEMSYLPPSVSQYNVQESRSCAPPFLTPQNSRRMTRDGDLRSSLRTRRTNEPPTIPNALNPIQPTP